MPIGNNTRIPLLENKRRYYSIITSRALLLDDDERTSACEWQHHARPSPKNKTQNMLIFLKQVFEFVIVFRLWWISFLFDGKE